LYIKITICPLAEKAEMLRISMIIWVNVLAMFSDENGKGLEVEDIPLKPIK